MFMMNKYQPKNGIGFNLQKKNHLDLIGFFEPSEKEEEEEQIGFDYLEK